MSASTCLVSGVFLDPSGNGITNATVRFNTDSPVFDVVNNVIAPSEVTTTTVYEYLFTVTGYINTYVGDTYTNNGATFTVVNALTSATGAVLYMTSTGTPTTTGSLTALVAVGTNPIAYSAYSTQSSPGSWSLSLVQGSSGTLTLDLPPSSTGPITKYKFAVVIPSTTTATFAQCWVDSGTFGGSVPSPLSWTNITPTMSGDVTVNSQGVATILGVSTAGVIPLSGLANISSGYLLGAYPGTNITGQAPSTVINLLPKATTGSQGLIPAITNTGTKYLRDDLTWQTVTSSGGSVYTVNAISTNTTAAASAGVEYAYLCSGTIVLTLPTAVGNTSLYSIKNVGSGVISIATTSSQTIDGTASPIQIKVQNASLDIISNGTNWSII